MNYASVLSNASPTVKYLSVYREHQSPSNIVIHLLSTGLYIYEYKLMIVWFYNGIYSATNYITKIYEVGMHLSEKFTRWYICRCESNFIVKKCYFFPSRGARCSTVNLTFQHVYNFRNSSQLVLNDLKISFFILRQNFFTNAFLRM